MSSIAATSNFTFIQRASAPPPTAPPAQAEEPVDDITVGQFFGAVGGAAAGAAIQTVGNTLDSVARMPQTVYHAYKALHETERIGPVLKGTLAVLIPAAAVAVPVATALGSCAVGLVRGFSDGMEEGVVAATLNAADDVRTFDRLVSEDLPKAMHEAAAEKLEPGEKPFDVTPKQAVQAVAGGAVAAAITGAGAAGSTALHTPYGVVRAYQEIGKAEMGPVSKASYGVLVPPLAALATPAALVGGTLYGFAHGAAEAYENGIGSAARQAVQDVKDYDRMVREALRPEEEQPEPPAPPAPPAPPPSEPPAQTAGRA